MKYAVIACFHFDDFNRIEWAMSSCKIVLCGELFSTLLP
jgi:hypothetical protein